MTIGERIKQRRKELNLSIDTIAEKLDKNRATVYRYESDYIENLPISTLEPLSKILKCSPAYLMGWEDEPKQNTKDEYIKSLSEKYDNIKPIKTKKFPMLGEIACGQPIYEQRDYETFIEASEDIKADFCLTAKGDSMINARIFNGDIVFIRSQSDVDNGEIAAVIIGDDVTLKRVYKYNNRLELRPENPLHSVQNYEGTELEQIHILGKAVAFQSYVR